MAYLPIFFRTKMKNFITKLRENGAFEEVPQFMSCSSFESSSEYIIHTQEPRLVFEVTEEGSKDDPFTRFIEHENGDQDFLVLIDCYSENYFDNMDQSQATEQITDIMDQMEGWYISEVLDLESYDEE